MPVTLELVEVAVDPLARLLLAAAHQVPIGVEVIAIVACPMIVERLDQLQVRTSCAPVGS